MPSPLRPFSRTSFEGGIDAVSSPYRISPKHVLRATNMLLDETGALSVRDGITTIDRAPKTVRSILRLPYLIRVDRTLQFLAIARTLTDTQELYVRNVPWTSVGVFDTLYDTPTATPWLNKLYIAAGYEVPKVWNGTALSALTPIDGSHNVPPGAKHMVLHENSLWAWNTADTYSAYDGPDSLRASEPGDPNSWLLPDNQVFIARGDGQEGTGIGVFTIAETGISPNAILVAFKNFSAYQVNGIFGAANFTINRIQTDMGCLAPRSIQFLPGSGIMRLTHRGFALYNGLQDQLTSELVRPYIFGHDDINGLNWQFISRSTSTQLQNPPIYVCACPSTTSTGGLDRVFIYDLARQAWTICTFPEPFATLDLILDTNTLPPYVLSGESQGTHVRQWQWEGQVERDDRTPVPWLVRFQPLPVNSLLQRSYHRRVLIKLFHTRARQQLTVTIVLGPATGGKSRRTITKTLTVRANAFPPGGPIQDTVDADCFFDIGAKGEVQYMQLEGTGAMVLRGIEWHASGMPLSRPQRI